MKETISDSAIDKFVNLTLDQNKNIIGIDDHRKYGTFDGSRIITFPNPLVEGKRTSFQINNVHTIELKDGIVTVKVKGNKTDNYPQYKPIEEVEAEEQPIDLLEPLDELDIIESKLRGLRLGIGGLGDTPIYGDDDGEIYGYFNKDYTIIHFCNGSTYNAYQCDYDTVSRVEKGEKPSIAVSFKDDTTKTFNRYVESESGDNPKPDFDGSYTAIEELIRYVFGSEKVTKCIYTSAIDHKPYFDWDVLGMPGRGIQEYQAAGDLTTLCQIVEQRTEYVEKNQLKHYRLSRDNVNHIIIKISQENEINPFLEMIKETKPDDRYKIEHFLRDVGIVSGLTDSDKNDEYVEKVSCAIFLAVIERQMVNDNERAIRFVPIIIGEQNKGKSLICKKLGLIDFHRESTESIEDTKKYIEGMDGGCVIAEIAEATQFVQGKEDEYKAWFGRNDYSFRRSYGRDSIKFQKRFLEIITTNNGQILTDITGNTRYYPLFLEPENANIPIQEHTKEMMLYYYADALKRYQNGKRWYDYVDNDDFQTVADMVRSGVTRDIEGLPELVEYINGFCPEVGNIIVNQEIRDYLNNQPYETKQIEKLVRLWGKISKNYGFGKLPEGYKVADGLTWKSVRGYRRLK